MRHNTLSTSEDGANKGALRLGTTTGGKTIQLKINPKGRLYIIEYREGGEVPDGLKGLFTSPEKAKTQCRTVLGERFIEDVMTTELNDGKEEKATKTVETKKVQGGAIKVENSKSEQKIKKV